MKINPLLLSLLLCASAALANEIKSPFNGKNLMGWRAMTREGGIQKWQVGKATMAPENPLRLEFGPDGSDIINRVEAHGQGLDLSTAQDYTDLHMEVEFMVPKGSSSGIFLMGTYEVQIKDSFGEKAAEMGTDGMGAVTGAAAPMENASKRAGEWQKLVLDFRAPKFNAAGKKTAPAVFERVELNGRVLHENVVMKSPTPGAMFTLEQPSGKGPLMFQGVEGPVAFRSLKISTLAGK